MISERSAEAADRAVPGHWEGDLIIGLGRSAIGTLVERTTRFTMLLHLPRMEGHGTVPRVKNGPALAGHGAEAVRDAIARDDHDIASAASPLADLGPGSRDGQACGSADRNRPSRLLLRTAQPLATQERTRTLMDCFRQYFPKGTDLSAHSPNVLAVVADALNTRPRKTLGWRTPAEALDQCLQASQTERVADDRLNPPSLLARPRWRRLPLRSTKCIPWVCRSRQADYAILAKIGASVLAYILFFEILRMVGAVQFSITSYVITLTGIGWGIMFVSVPSGRDGFVRSRKF